MQISVQSCQGIRPCHCGDMQWPVIFCARLVGAPSWRVMIIECDDSDQKSTKVDINICVLCLSTYLIIFNWHFFEIVSGTYRSKKYSLSPIKKWSFERQWSTFRNFTMPLCFLSKSKNRVLNGTYGGTSTNDTYGFRHFFPPKIYCNLIQ